MAVVERQGAEPPLCEQLAELGDDKLFDTP
jgi:hypothetical protein